MARTTRRTGGADRVIVQVIPQDPQHPHAPGSGAGVSGFGPPPGAPEPVAPRRPASYLPPGGLGASGTPGQTAYRHRYAVGAAHKPGIIALKPLGLGDVLDGSTKLARRAPGTVLGMSAVVNALAVLPALALVVAVNAGTWFVRSGASRIVDVDNLVGLLLTAGTVLATAALTGLLAPVAGEAILGRYLGLGPAWRAVRPSLAPLAGAALAVVAVVVGPWVVAVVGVVLVADAPVPVILAVGVVLGAAALATTVAALPRLLFAAPALALERLGLRAGLARAVELSRGRYWSILGTSLLVLAVGILLVLLLELLGLVVGSVAVDLLDLPRTQSATARDFVVPLSTLVSATVVTPFLAGAVVLQYVDARMRKEGLDLVLLRGATARAGAGS